MRELVNARIKTIPAEIANLKSEYHSARGKMTEIKEEIKKSRSSKPN